MSNELQTKLDKILEIKKTVIIPENIKAGVDILGVSNGTLVGITETENEDMLDTCNAILGLPTKTIKLIHYKSDADTSTWIKRFKFSDTQLNQSVTFRYGAKTNGGIASDNDTKKLSEIIEAYPYITILDNGDDTDILFGKTKPTRLGLGTWAMGVDMHSGSDENAESILYCSGGSDKPYFDVTTGDLSINMLSEYYTTLGGGGGQPSKGYIYTNYDWTEDFDDSYVL